jgi:hypothetical protein
MRAQTAGTRRQPLGLHGLPRETVVKYFRFAALVPILSLAVSLPAPANASLGVVCSKFCNQFDYPGGLCGCQVTTFCSNGRAYYWFSPPVDCPPDGTDFCKPGSAGCPG